MLRPNPAAHPEGGGIRLLETQGGSRVHWRTGMGRSFEVPDKLMMTAATNGQAGIGPVPMMPQISWPIDGGVWASPDGLAAGGAGAMGRDLFMPNPSAHPEGGIRLLETQGGSRVH